MVLAEHPLPGLQGALEERLGLAIAALSKVQFSQIADAGKRIGMLFAEPALCERQRLLSDPDCLSVLPVAIKLGDLLIEGGEVIRPFCICVPGDRDGKQHRSHQNKRAYVSNPL